MITLDRISADDHPLLVWTAQDMRTGARAWTFGDAAAVACRDVSRRDRLALRGSPDDAAELVRRLRPQVTGFHPVADAALMDALADRVEGLELVVRLGWMETTAPSAAGAAGAAGKSPAQPVAESAGKSPAQPAGNDPAWLTGAELSEVSALLAAEHPTSWAKPGDSGVRRFAGVRDDHGVLQAVGADAWSVPEIGFVAGVVTRQQARGRGLGTALCAFLTDELIEHRDRVALLVEMGNAPAIRTYERLGYELRPIAAARFTAS